MIELLQFRYGPGVYQQAGTVLELTAEEEQRLIEAGAAKWVESRESRDESQQTMRPTPETATKPKPDDRRRPKPRRTANV